MAVAGAAVFVWTGMVLAISFLEAPLKFRAPGVTTTIGLARLLAVRPRLRRHSDAVLAGGDPPRSHLVYIALEVVKLVALPVAGVVTLSAV